MRIVASAIKVDSGRIYIDKRHHLIIPIVCKMENKKFCDDEQGFIGEDWKFYTREDAELIARTSGQLTKKLIGSVLTSEDLW